MAFVAQRMVRWWISGAVVWLPLISTPVSISNRDLSRTTTHAVTQHLRDRLEHSACPADIETLTTELLRDLPSYANRASQEARRLNRKGDVYGYVLLAGRPEFAPLTLGPGEYAPAGSATVAQEPQQVFFTTLERQYTLGKLVELQGYHWLFLTQTASGWRLAMMFSQFGSYPAGRPPTPPQDSSHGVIAQGIRTWLGDCRAGAVRPSNLKGSDRSGG